MSMLHNQAAHRETPGRTSDIGALHNPYLPVLNPQQQNLQRAVMRGMGAQVTGNAW
jgi:hypothetical protein